MHSFNESKLSPTDSNCRLREILVKIQDRLSDDDRKRFHFYLGDDVPRRIRDDPTLYGTLSLMQSLIDQDKINEKDFTYLTNAFQAIGCHDLARILREYKKQLQSFESVTSSIIDQILGETPDHAPSRQFLMSHPNTKIKLPEEETCQLIHETIPLRSSLSESNSQKSPNIRLYQNLLRILLPLFILCLLSSLYLLLFHQKQCRTDQHLTSQKDNSIISKQSMNETKYLQRISQLTEELDKLKERLNTFPLLFGRIWGLPVEEPFDDSLSENFNSSYFLAGYESYQDDEGIHSYHFQYHTSNNRRDNIAGEKRPNIDEMLALSGFLSSNGKKIYRVDGRIIEKTLFLSNGTQINGTIIDQLEFYSQEKSSNLNNNRGVPFREEYPGYSIYYVRGFMKEYIHQIQFIWRSDRYQIE